MQFDRELRISAEKISVQRLLGPSDVAKWLGVSSGWVRDHATPHHVPRKILQVADIPRIVSGKITELAVRDVVHGRPVANVDALANPRALEHFRDLEELRS